MATCGIGSQWGDRPMLIAIHPAMDHTQFQVWQTAPETNIDLKISHSYEYCIYNLYLHLLTPFVGCQTRWAELLLHLLTPIRLFASIYSLFVINNWWRSNQPHQCFFKMKSTKTKIWRDQKPSRLWLVRSLIGRELEALRQLKSVVLLRSRWKESDPKKEDVKPNL